MREFNGIRNELVFSALGTFTDFIQMSVEFEYQIPGYEFHIV
jgi:hypothetical protein